MLDMGFVNDIRFLMTHVPEERQTLCFSATMSKTIEALVQDFLKDPTTVSVRTNETPENIEQNVMRVRDGNKVDMLHGLLKDNEFKKVLIFGRTKRGVENLSRTLTRRGVRVESIHSDKSQIQRKRALVNFKENRIQVLTATDVAARGLHIDDVSHVINYEVPETYDDYIHRIGRTGRAGRKGEAILFVSPREKRILHSIEKATKQKIELMDLPSTEIINDNRIARFKQRITDTLAAEELEFYNQLLEQYQQEHDIPAIEIAAALAKLVQGDSPLLLKNKPQRQRSETRPNKKTERPKKDQAPNKQKSPSKPQEEMERYRLEVGKKHGVQAGNIVGAIANEAGLEGQYIQKITIHEDFCTVDLPSGMPRSVFKSLKKVWVSGQQLKISLLSENKKQPEGKSSPKRQKKRSSRKDS